MQFGIALDAICYEHWCILFALIVRAWQNWQLFYETRSCRLLHEIATMV
jgi:hypothetical protein